jgi:hypothetical protein
MLTDMKLMKAVDNLYIEPCKYGKDFNLYASHCLLKATIRLDLNMQLTTNG